MSLSEHLSNTLCPGGYARLPISQRKDRENKNARAVALSGPPNSVQASRVREKHVAAVHCSIPIPMTTPPLPEQIELHRDRMWRRDEDLRIESAVDAERFIEDVGFANTLTDARRAGPSLYIAVCGRRDVSLPRNVLPKGEETCASLTSVPVSADLSKTTNRSPPQTKTASRWHPSGIRQFKH
jgi:hypothetical protein